MLAALVYLFFSALGTLYAVTDVLGGATVSPLLYPWGFFLLSFCLGLAVQRFTAVLLPGVVFTLFFAYGILVEGTLPAHYEEAWGIVLLFLLLGQSLACGGGIAVGHFSRRRGWPTL